MANKNLKRKVGVKAKRRRGDVMTLKAETLTGPALRSAMGDILGRFPKELTIEFEKLGPGGVRAAEGEWSGNIYKYRY